MLSKAAITSVIKKQMKSRRLSRKSPLNGKAVNALRSSLGKGVLVWGAQPLDDNSQNWRYINARRTVIFIEQTVNNEVVIEALPSTSSSTVMSLVEILGALLSVMVTVAVAVD